ncbi:MAG: phosphate regulon sensor histidine kinase PhoR [Candidatus Kapaibacteriales bacterium]
MVTINKVLTPVVSEYVAKGETGELTLLVNGYSNTVNARITVMDMNGDVIAESKKDESSMDNHSNRPEVKKALLGEEAMAERYSSTLGQNMIYVASPVISNGEQVAVLRASFFDTKLRELMLQLFREMILVALIILFVATIIILLFSRKLTKPLNQLSLAASRVASGDFNTKVKMRGDDELADLSLSFNNMTKRIKKLFDKVISQKEELDALIYTIQEGLLVIKKNGQIAIFNESFKRIVGKSNISGHTLKSVLDNSQLEELLGETARKNQPISKEITFDNKSFIVSTNSILTKEEIVVLFHDITEIKKFEEIKKDLVVNVSHELRTPLTAIKGFVEMLEDDIPKEQKYYLSIISKHTDRLIRIVGDLLTLSELEKDKLTELELTKVNIKDIIDYTVKLLELKARDKGLYIKSNFQDDIPKIKLDRYRIEQVLINLLENAIKYTDKGGIDLAVTSSGKKITIEVKDSGIGIPKEDQSRIFERFYTVDKSRSRRVGGTGLGLSIVKHIINLHKGEIFLESEKDQGTRFIITLPI